MKKILIVFFISIFKCQLIFSQVDLSHIEKKENKSQVSELKTSTDAKKDTTSKSNTKKGKTNNAKNKKVNKPKPKKISKKEKYVFKKEEQNFYKFDEKGNPIVKKPVKNSTSTVKKTDLVIGLENKEVNLKNKEK